MTKTTTNCEICGQDAVTLSLETLGTLIFEVPHLPDPVEFDGETYFLCPDCETLAIENPEAFLAELDKVYPTPQTSPRVPTIWEVGRRITKITSFIKGSILYYIVKTFRYIFAPARKS